MSDEGDEFVFGGYKPGGGKLAERALELAGGSDECDIPIRIPQKPCKVQMTIELDSNDPRLKELLAVIARA